jgi:predicted DCC family thiol-disulfide oxidoreductase YuxK
MQPSWKPRKIAGVPDGLILFDGVCVLCSGWVRFLLKRDRAGYFRFTPIQSPYGRELVGRLGIDPENPETNVLIDGGCAYFKFDTVIQVLARVPYWRWTRAFVVLPRVVRNWIYDRIARNRYRVFGKTEHCMLPSPEVSRRFLTEYPAEN